MQERNWLPWIIGCLVVIMVCCVCLVIVGAGGLLYSVSQSPEFQATIEAGSYPAAATSTPVVARPTAISPQATPVPVSTETLRTLEQAIVPNNDPIALARRLGGHPDVPLTLTPPAEFFRPGAQQTFWVTNVDDNSNFQIQATLHYVTDHAYFWVQDGVDFNQGDLERLAEAFENKIYPTDRAFFGSEWTPGVDGDPHVYLLYARGLGENLAGYFSSADELHPLAHEYSNAHEMFLFNADNVDLGDEFTYGVLAHEFQHMIHWYQDRNESSWLNEGFSELAAFLNGYDVGGFDYAYMRDPDIQLTYWPTDDTTPHYGAGFLFLTYFLDRFGEQATQSLVAHPENGMVSVQAVLDEIGAQDTLTASPLSANAFFRDWTIANYLMTSDAYNGIFTYHNYADAPQATETERVRRCPQRMQTRDVHQYGVDYIRITCQGQYTLHFEGGTQVGLLPADAHSGAYAFWSNQGDESDMTLTHQFDFTGVEAPMMEYWTWYDIEKDYDYVYLEASTDGETWQILQPPSSTDADPSGNSYGWAYNGKSGGSGVWIREQVDLSQFAGQQVYLRFEYITDAAVNGEGFLLDDVSIPAIGYHTDFEEDDGGWQGDGFVRIENILPQTFQVSLITRTSSGLEVTPLSLEADNSLTLPMEIGRGEEVILVVSGTTPFTHQKAAYRFEITP
ncbi:MAG: hypothetical protein D6755_04205 [Anaerolineae bacterium]|nr:MAG: hypothetical protein D6755_04205 [Anaerolineae bacterium]